jgi:predicted XRE-type DNA-binding protein
MSTLKSKNIDTTFELGSINVFADLGMPDAEEKLAKAKLAHQINKIIKHKKLKQTEAAKLLNVDQAKISLLNRGRLSDFSIERLVRYLTLLNQDVEIVIKKSKRRSPHHGILSVTYA